MAEKSLFQDKLLPIMVVALIGAAFALGMMWGKVQVYEKGGVGNGTAAGTPQAQAPEPELPLTDDQWKSIQENPVYAYGDENAPVTLVEFTDFQCPFCKRYVDDTMKTIEENYVNTGKVRYLVHDLPLSFHANAKPAAIAARCAVDQDKYLEMHAKLFGSQEAWSNLSDATETFTGYASELGMNTGTFTACLTDEAVAKAVDDDLALAASVGANGTPTFFVNGQRLVGAQPLSSFEAIIEAEL